MWAEKNGVPHSIASNAPDPDGLIVFPVGAYGRLGEAKFQDGEDGTVTAGSITQIDTSGGLKAITTVTIPYQGPQGLTGF